MLPDFSQYCDDHAYEIEHFIEWLNDNKDTPDAKALLLMMMEVCYLMETFKSDFSRYEQRDMLVDFYVFAADQDGGVWGDPFERFVIIDQMVERNRSIDILESCFKKSKDLTR